MGHGGKPWVSDFNHPHYQAGRRALKTGWLSSEVDARSLRVSEDSVVACCTHDGGDGVVRGLRCEERPEPQSIGVDS